MKFSSFDLFWLLMIIYLLCFQFEGKQMFSCPVIIVEALENVTNFVSILKRYVSFDIFEFNIVPLYFFFFFICTWYMTSFISSFSKMKMKAKIYQAPKTSVSDIVMNDYLLDGLSKNMGLSTKCYSVNGNAIVFIRSPESHRWTFSHLFSFLNLSLL